MRNSESEMTLVTSTFRSKKEGIKSDRMKIFFSFGLCLCRV